MGINLKVTDEDKKCMTNFATEFSVLNVLAGERKFLMDKKAEEIMMANELDIKLYAMHFNPPANKWEAVLKPGALAIPVPGSNPMKVKEN